MTTVTEKLYNLLERMNPEYSKEGIKTIIHYIEKILWIDKEKNYVVTNTVEYELGGNIPYIRLYSQTHEWAKVSCGTIEVDKHEKLDHELIELLWELYGKALNSNILTLTDFIALVVFVKRMIE
jgi:hypothetical protein